MYVYIYTWRYSTRFSGGLLRSGASSESQSTSNVDTPPLIPTLDSSRPDKHRKRKRGSKEASDT